VLHDAHQELRIPVDHHRYEAVIGNGGGYIHPARAWMTTRTRILNGYLPVSRIPGLQYYRQMGLSINIASRGGRYPMEKAYDPDFNEAEDRVVVQLQLRVS
jgi:hypothetical protein